VSCAERTRLDCVVVESLKFTAAGYACCAVAVFGLATQVAAATAPWCVVEMRAFRDVMLVALAADVAVAQPVYAGLAHAWRWLSHEGDGDEGSDDGDESPGCTHVTHELHPIDGQWRYAGALVVGDRQEDACE